MSRLRYTMRSTPRPMQGGEREGGGIGKMIMEAVPIQTRPPKEKIKRD